MLRITLLAELVLLLWNVPEARQYTARSLRSHQPHRHHQVLQGLFQQSSELMGEVRC